MTSGVPACEECGYELTGIGGAMEWTRCPECGEPFVVASAWARRPWWPGALAGFGAMCGPSVMFLIAAWGAVTSWQVQGAGLLIGIGCVLFSVLPPVLISGRLAERHMLRGRRGIGSWAIAAAGIVFNAAVSLVAARLM